MRQVIVPIAFMTMVALITVVGPLARAFARRIELGVPDRTPALPPDATARLERMENAIESIAIEVERLAEGQRFTTKLLAERGAPGDAMSRDAAPREVAQRAFAAPAEARQP